MHSKLLDDENVQQKFLCLKNQRAAFVAILEEIVNKNEDTFLVKQACLNGHYNFIRIAQSLFNCFAKHELERINQCAVDHPAKMAVAYASSFQNLHRNINWIIALFSCFDSAIP